MAPTVTAGDMLLQAILEEPQADDLRLIYADWLQDHGEPVPAEFIRVQVALAQPSKEEDPDLLKKERDLWETNLPDKTWAIGVPWYSTEVAQLIPQNYMATSSCNQLLWRRGFVYLARLPKDLWRKYGEELASTHPLARVELESKNPRRGFHHSYEWHICDVCSIGAPSSIHPDLVGTKEDDFAFHSREAAFDWLSERLILQARNKKKRMTHTL